MLSTYNFVSHNVSCMPTGPVDVFQLGSVSQQYHKGQQQQLGHRVQVQNYKKGQSKDSSQYLKSTSQHLKDNRYREEFLKEEKMIDVKRRRRRHSS